MPHLLSGNFVNRERKIKNNAAFMYTVYAVIHTNTKLGVEWNSFW